jgi:deoxyhypusine synthase
LKKIDNKIKNRKSFEGFDIKKNKTFALSKRKHKVSFESFAKPSNHKTSIEKFILSLPDILVAKDFKNLVNSIKKSKKNKKPIVWALGAHVIKTGLNPVMIKLMKEGYVDLIAFNGAGIIHDTEIALVGESSEEVSDGIKDGTFGMVKETGKFINESIEEASQNDMGLGEFLGKKILESNCPYKSKSILANCSKLGIPVTVHVSIGTDIIHMHPNVNGAAIGKTSMKDFMIFSKIISKMSGGVFLNVGSAVILPEVFLKAITMVRNQGFNVGNFDTATFDFNQHYRPMQNVVKRPTSTLGGNGYYFVGHHEIMIPLLASALL